MGYGGKCFGMKNTDNGREKEVAGLVFCRCFFKSEMHHPYDGKLFGGPRYQIIFSKYFFFGNYF